MPAMPFGSFVRSVHQRLFVAPVRRAVAEEVARAGAQLMQAVGDADREVRRLLGDLADANDQVAEAIGRSLIRLSAEIEVLHGELGRLGVKADEPGPRH